MPLTVTCTSSLATSEPSLAVSRSTYVPAAPKLAVVDTLVGLANVTVPGPEALVHMKPTATGGFGSPSSFAVPFSVAVAGSVMLWSVPALTVGAPFPSAGSALVICVLAMPLSAMVSVPFAFTSLR